MHPSEIASLQATADAARSEKLAQIGDLRLLAIATNALLTDISEYIKGHACNGAQVLAMVRAHREQLQPLAASLGFSIDPSPVYVGEFILTVK